MSDPWAPTHERPDEYSDWKAEAAAGDTVLGFADWLAHQDDLEDNDNE